MFGRYEMEISRANGAIVRKPKKRFRGLKLSKNVSFYYHKWLFKHGEHEEIDYENNKTLF